VILPNVIIAGAPRSGTTSLFTWLADHPEVCGSRVKETRFLLDRGDPGFNPDLNYHDHGLASYETYFEHCRAANARVILEATPHYLYQDTASSVLAELDPLPHIVFVLRKPSNRIYSYYQFARNDRALLPSELTFRQFVSLAKEGWPGRETRGYVREVVDQSRYLDHLRRWLDRFPGSHLHVFLFEELVSSPHQVGRRVAEQIGIDPDFYAGYPFRPRNPAYRVRWHRLHKTRRALGRRLPSRPKSLLKRATQKAYSRLNVQARSSAGSDEEKDVLAQLDREFQAQNELLSRVLRMDLSAWD
jgi:hypothetical protein